MIELLGGLSNAIRGGQWKEWLGLPEDSVWGKIPSDAINAAIFAAAVLWIHGNPVLAAASYGAMWLGAAKGWGDYIGALGGWRISDLKEVRWIDAIIKPLIAKPKLWGWAGLSLRGAYWGACLAAPFAYYGLPWAQFILLGATMPLCYWLAIQWAWHRARGNWQSAGWGLGEIFFGFALWNAL